MQLALVVTTLRKWFCLSRLSAKFALREQSGLMSDLEKAIRVQSNEVVASQNDNYLHGEMISRTLSALSIVQKL